MLRDMESIVRGIYDKCIIDLPRLFESGDEIINQFINTLKSTKSLAVVVVIVINDRLIPVWLRMNPAYTGWLAIVS